ncbi:phosphoribosyltransferase-like protein [Paraclostridium bifermentans]|uniref:phosphoribosyltransferase-like protein n=1 Tax=Paraclostridium bifermentans TaxID=1490 RepID=UPI0034DF6C5A
MDYKNFEKRLEDREDFKSQKDKEEFLKILTHQTLLTDLIDTVGKERVKEWFDQFEEKDKEIAYDIFSKINYYDSNTVNIFCKLAFINFQINNKTDSSDTIFVPIGSAGKSGQMIGYLFRTANNIPQSQFIYEEKLIYKKKVIYKGKVIYKDKLNENIIKKYKHVVFIDDFTGTGEQFLKNKVVKLLTDYVESSSENKPKLTFITLVATENAVENIQQKNIIEVIAQHIRRRAFAIDDEKFINFNQKYGEGLCVIAGKDLYLGWRETGETIVFYYNVPNNTLPIIWSDNISPYTKKEWVPLFPRSRIAKSKKLFFIENNIHQLYYKLCNSELYSEDYVHWLGVIKEIYVQMNIDTFTIKEYINLLEISCKFMYPFDLPVNYHSPFTYLYKIRIDILEIIKKKIEIKCTDEEMYLILELFNLDRYTVTQGYSIYSEVKEIIKLAISNNEEYYQILFNYMYDTNDNTLIIQDIACVILSLLNEIPSKIISLNIPKLKKCRTNKNNPTLQYWSEKILSINEDKNSCFDDINFNKVYVFVNYYGKYKIIPLDTAIGHLGIKP